MKIAIIGAGAMGCLYGAKLSENPDNQVYLLDVWKDHIDAINENGLIMEENGGEIVYNKVKGALDPAEVGVVDLAVVFVKSTLTETAVKNNAAVFGRATVALTLQNGLGNIDLISKVVGKDNVLAGTTAHGATMLGPGKMRHAGAGVTIIGELTGEKTDRLTDVYNVLNQAGMETEISDNVLGLIWDKLLVNVGINALTGITKLHNGQLLERSETETLLELAVKEGEAVAKARGVSLSFQNPVEHAKEVCRATSANKSSMLQDVLNGRQTEIDMINGAIVREGKAVDVETPVNLTLTNLIKTITESK